MLDAVIGWSIAARSRLGYFAALYKRITIAVRTAIDDGAFEDGPRMQLFDAAFANRYFEALNGMFHPARHPKPTRAWQVTFDAADRLGPIILQHMLAGVNAHILLDLGIVAQQSSPGRRLPGLRRDFDTINAVLASQVDGIVDDINDLSPALADIYHVLADHEIFIIGEAVAALRDSAWRFATVLATEPAFLRPATISVCDRYVASKSDTVYHPPQLVGIVDSVVLKVAARESRDVVANIEVLDELASHPAPIRTSL